VLSTVGTRLLRVPLEVHLCSWRCLTDGGSAAARRELPEYRAAADRAPHPGPGGGR
jgi:hypothetical protein